MPIPLITTIGTLALSMASKGQKYARKHSSSSIGQAAQFGVGYGAFTNIGYNISNEAVTKHFRKSYNNNYSTTSNLYSSYSGHRRSTRKKFSFVKTRYFNTRVYNRKYRKSVYIHRQYGGRY